MRPGAPDGFTYPTGLKQVGEGIVRPTGRWVVTELHLPEDGGVAFELFVTREVHT